MLSKSQVKYIQSLGQKKLRDAEGVFVAEGPKIVKELLESGKVKVVQVYALKEWIDNNKNLLSGHLVNEVTNEELQRISSLATANQVIALLEKIAYDENVPLKNLITLVLDTIQDPGNMGTIIRIADWFGVGQIVCSRECADVFNPKTVQASMGSITRVNLFYTDLLGWLGTQNDMRIYATSLEGKSITDLAKIREGLIIIGNESKGIHADILAMADEKLTIPRFGKAESLNAAVATGIVLSHLI